MTLAPLMAMVASQAQEAPVTVWGFASVVAMQIGRIVQQGLHNREVIRRLDAQDRDMAELKAELQKKGVISPDPSRGAT